MQARVRIASDERYPWRLGAFESERGALPAGDYALVLDGTIVAVVERKTLEGLLAEFSRMDVLRQRVLEAPYEDFLNPAKVQHWSAAFCARAIADMYARYPRLRVVFCANRKMAEAWTRNYIVAVSTVASGLSAQEPTGD